MRSPDVDAWFASHENLQKDVLLYIRLAILDSDERIEESVKWKSPTSSHKRDIASFNPRSTQHASLMFHTGASIPGEFPHLEGSGDVACCLKVADVAPAREREPELVAIVKAWCDARDVGEEA
jgi:hypothetical protein